MGEEVCDILIFYGRILTDYVSGWYVHVGYINMFGFVEMDLCDLQFCLYVIVGFFLSVWWDFLLLCAFCLVGALCNYWTGMFCEISQVSFIVLWQRLFYVNLERILVLFFVCVLYLCWIAVVLVLFVAVLPCVSRRFLLRVCFV